MTVDDRLSLLALVDGVPLLQSAVVVHRDQQVLHVSTDEPLPLPIGNVVALLAHATSTEATGTLGGTGPDPDLDGGWIHPSFTSLALVSESVGPTITALRLLERRP
jgi:hypothetical protein